MSKRTQQQLVGANGDGNHRNNKNNNKDKNNESSGRPRERRKNRKTDEVQCDGRLKIVINRENQLRARWPERWGFYSKNNVETLWSEEAVELGLPDNFIDLRRQKLRKPDRIQPLIKVSPSPHDIPKTSSGFIGWRSSHSVCNLEMFGRCAAFNKLDTRMLKSDDEPDQKHQRFIILG